MVGALYRDAERLFGSVNVKVLESCADFGAQQTVSPKTLAADEKKTRWQNIWFSDVRVVGLY
jgi:hypothetical protein